MPICLACLAPLAHAESACGLLNPLAGGCPDSSRFTMIDIIYSLQSMNAEHAHHALATSSNFAGGSNAYLATNSSHVDVGQLDGVPHKPNVLVSWTCRTPDALEVQVVLPHPSPSSSSGLTVRALGTWGKMIVNNSSQQVQIPETLQSTLTGSPSFLGREDQQTELRKAVTVATTRDVAWWSSSEKWPKALKASLVCG